MNGERWNWVPAEQVTLEVCCIYYESHCWKIKKMLKHYIFKMWKKVSCGPYLCQISFW